MQGKFLALGDSLTTGYGVGVSNSFATLYFSRLRSNYPNLQYENLGVDGLISRELTSMLRQPGMSNLIARSSLITITIGSNDLLAIGKDLMAGKPINPQSTLSEFTQNLLTLGLLLRQLNPTATIKIATIYNPLPPMNKELNALSNTLLNIANSSIRKIGREYGLIVVPVAKAFQGRERVFIGPDHVHPSIEGHQTIADLFYRY
ncbi:MAG: lipase [Desulfitobacterium sp.]|nr:lipase [Desulfitobacterium sp.]